MRLCIRKSMGKVLLASNPKQEGKGRDLHIRLIPLAICLEVFLTTWLKLPRAWLRGYFVEMWHDLTKPASSLPTNIYLSINLSIIMAEFFSYPSLLYTQCSQLNLNSSVTFSEAILFSPKYAFICYRDIAYFILMMVNRNS